MKRSFWIRRPFLSDYGCVGNRVNNTCGGPDEVRPTFRASAAWSRASVECFDCILRGKRTRRQQTSNACCGRPIRCRSKECDGRLRNQIAPKRNRTGGIRRRNRVVLPSRLDDLPSITQRAFALVQRHEHVVDEARDLAVDFGNRRSLRFQDRVAVGSDFVRHEM